MGGLHKYMFRVLIFMLGLTFAHGYDSRTSRKFDILERKMETVTMELLDVKADLRVEKAKSITLENKLNDLINDKKVKAYDDKDSDQTEHHSVFGVHNQQEVGSQAMSVEQRIYDAMKDAKNVRKQFEKQMKTDFMTANKHTEMKFTALKETLSAVIDKTLDTIEDKVRASVTVLNDASSSIANLTIKVQQNVDAITSLMLDSDQLNTTILRCGTKMETVEVELANKVQQNNKSITSLMLESHKLNTTLFRYGIMLETIEVDLANNVEELIDNNHRYKVCLNGGNYSDDGLCECIPPHYGNNCEKVCLNGGNYSDDGLCECIPPHYGNNCEKGCFNDGKYMEDGSCECSRLYVGAKCEKVRCFNGAKHSEDGTCECTMPYYGTHCEKVYTDCYDIHQHTDKPTGIYTVAPRGSNKNIKVKCDMNIDGGGWTVFQYRHDGSFDFYRKFDEYENGFGNLNGEFWLGLRYVQLMTSFAPTVLRIDVAAANGTKAYQTYEDFNISEGPDYRLNIGATSGTAGDSISSKKRVPFSTHDHDRDGNEKNCALRHHGAWWYDNCTGVNLNGEYLTPGTSSTIDSAYRGMFYYNSKTWESLKSSKMMFRRK